MNFQEFYIQVKKNSSLCVFYKTMRNGAYRARQDMCGAKKRNAYAYYCLLILKDKGDSL